MSKDELSRDEIFKKLQDSELLKSAGKCKYSSNTDKEYFKKGDSITFFKHTSNPDNRNKRLSASHCFVECSGNYPLSHILTDMEQLISEIKNELKINKNIRWEKFLENKKERWEENPVRPTFEKLAKQMGKELADKIDEEIMKGNKDSY